MAHIKETILGFLFFCIWAFTRVISLVLLFAPAKPTANTRSMGLYETNLKPKMAHIKETILGFLFLYLGFHQVISLVEMFTISYHLFCVLFGIILIYTYLCSDFRVGS